MAKHDFCFTYYDGDAARDMAHMNRLERGAYSDLVVSQRKFGRLSMSLIKKTLGNDFEGVWESLEVVLIKEEEKYFIEWLENSVSKMQKQSLHQAGNGSKGGRPKKPNDNPNHNLNETQTITQTPINKKPLGNENGNGDEYGFIKEKEETQKSFPSMPMPEDVGSLPEIFPGSCVELLKLTVKKTVSHESVKALWPVFKIQNLTGKKYYPDVGAVHTHFMNWIKLQKFENESGNNLTKQQKQSAARDRLLQKGVDLYAAASGAANN